MKYFFLFTITLFLLLSCNNDSTKIYSESDNNIEGTLHYEYEGEWDDKIKAEEFISLETSFYSYPFNFEDLDLSKRYQIEFITDAGDHENFQIGFQTGENKDNIELIDDEFWQYKTIEDELEFINNLAYGSFAHRGATLNLRDENVINNSRIVETDTGQDIFVDFEIPSSIFYGRNTIYQGEYYYDENYSSTIKNLKVQFLINYDSF